MEFSGTFENISSFDWQTLLTIGGLSAAINFIIGALKSLFNLESSKLKLVLVFSISIVLVVLAMFMTGIEITFKTIVNNVIFALFVGYQAIVNKKAKDLIVNKD